MTGGAHLIIPDAHAHPNYDNKRFKALGRYIAERQPETIICIGDFADMPSLSHYDKGKLSGEGRNYKKDIQCAIDAQDRLFTQLAKVRGYKPRMVMCLGNHEDRINRAVNDDRTLPYSTEDLQYEKFGWEVHPFLDVVTVDGICYSHYFATGVSGRAISGEAVARSLCNKLHCSAVQGHSHVFDHAERSRINKTKIFGLSVGCYVHEDMVEGWNRATSHMWWRGVVLLEDVDMLGYYDSITAITQRKILRDFL